jgi:hypothetical protein
MPADRRPRVSASRPDGSSLGFSDDERELLLAARRYGARAAR